mmetsp:Transcript_22176/g.22490  ORF Transcript_22176/g.22490 Transcript_22176/m.22490 type:complete len:86 (+) Transcript_22176:308-565(+)
MSCDPKRQRLIDILATTGGPQERSLNRTQVEMNCPVTLVPSSHPSQSPSTGPSSKPSLRPSLRPSDGPFLNHPQHCPNLPQHLPR